MGSFPDRNDNLFPERHLGLVPPQESDNISGALAFATEQINEHVDLGRSLAIWRKRHNPWDGRVAQAETRKRLEAAEPVMIGVIRDAAFQFYYPENLEALEERGAIIKEISSLASRPLPTLDALYIGGGFPETHLEGLGRNSVFRESLRDEIERGLPVYAECGGLMFLCRGIYRAREHLSDDRSVSV